jgi:hypothetical protein
MAMRAFERARQLSSESPHVLSGIGATASLATKRPKRGAHRIHVAWQSATTTAVTTCLFPSADGTRDEEETVATQMVLHRVAEACGIRSLPPVQTPLGFQVSSRIETAASAWSDLLLGARDMVMVGAQPSETSPAILFPGAFNPPHWGHDRMAQIASQRFGANVTFELSITNVDKSPLDFIDIADRLQQLAGRTILLTRAPTFVEKSQVAPGCVFVVGVDTIERIADPVYYQGNEAQRDAAIAAIAGRGCRFLVFGRSIAGSFASLSAAKIPAQLRAICDEVPESDFNADVSSTELRAKGTQ